MDFPFRGSTLKDTIYMGTCEIDSEMQARIIDVESQMLSFDFLFGMDPP